MNEGRGLLFKACVFVVFKLSVFNLMCVTFFVFLNQETNQMENMVLLMINERGK